MTLARPALYCYLLSDMQSIPDNRKSRGRPKTGIGKPVGLRLYEDVERRIDAWVESQPDKPGRPEAIRRLINKALDSHDMANRRKRRR
jgi:hypothetical protein